ncbi:TPA: hypothetical protein ACN30S_001252 [Vibrio campbellii]
MDVDENGYLLNEDGYWTFRGYTEREILTRDIYSCHPLAYERYEKGQPDTKKDYIKWIKEEYQELKDKMEKEDNPILKNKNIATMKLYQDEFEELNIKY